ncbi:MAG: hypothetical protein ABFD54_11400 [Armatimonadota bacterium]
MSASPINTFSGQMLEALPGYHAITEALGFMPNLTIARGTLLGQVSAASANEVQTIDFSAGGDAPTGGTFTLSITGTDGATYSTAALAYNISNANIKIAIDALLAAAGYAGATVTITNGPAPADVTITFGGTAAAWDMPLMTVSSALTSSGTPTVAVVATTPGNHVGLWGPYVSTKVADPTAAPTVAELAGGTSLPLLGQFIVAYTFITAQGETLPSPGTAVALTSTNRSLRVSAITVPTGATGVNYYINGFFAATGDGTQKDITALATTASKPLPTRNTAYTNTDGRHIAKAIAKEDFRTNSLGQVAYAGSGQQPQYGVYDPCTTAYTKGAFKTTELTGLTADAVADLSGKIIRGTLSDGVLVI